MVLSKLYIWISHFFKSVIDVYDKSFLSHIIGSICSFFGKKYHDSFFANQLKNHAPARDKIQNSLTFGIVSCPFAFLKNFYLKNEDKIENSKSQSRILAFFHNAKNIPVRQLGLIFVCISLGMLLGVVAFADTDFLNIFLPIVILVSALMMLLSAQSVSCVLKNSLLFKYIRSLLFINSCAEENSAPYSIPLFKSVCVFSFLLSFVLCIASPYAVVIALFICSLIPALILKPARCVYLMVFCAPLLPTMANALLVAFTLFVYLLHMALGKNTHYRPSSFAVVILAFLIFSFLSALFSITPKSSVAVFAMYFVFTLSFVLVSNIIKDKSEWKTTAALFVLSSFAVSLYGIIQNYTLDATTQSWVDPSMFSDITTRVYSTLANPNVLGQFLILTVPVTFACIIYILKQKGKKSTLLGYMAFALVSVICLAFTWSRSAWVGVVMAVVILLCLNDKRWIALCIAGIFVLPLVLPESILARLTSIGNTNDTSTTYRIAVWKSSVNMIRDYPLCGIGLGSDAFLTMYRRYALSGAEFALHAHNFYLQWIADMGVWGLVIFISIILTAYSLISSFRNKRTLMYYVSIGFGCAVVGYLFQGLAETQWYNYRMVLVFWICMAIIQSASDIDAREEICK